MQIAIDAAGFDPAEADELRRAMATFKRVGTIRNFEHKMIDGMTTKGYGREFAERCFEQIKGFGEYGFPESHAASFAILVYASSRIKCHYPDVFAAALLNSQPMGFYAPAQIVRDAQEHGVEVREVDINSSHWDCTLEPAPRSASHPRHISMQGDPSGRTAPPCLARRAPYPRQAWSTRRCHSTPRCRAVPLSQGRGRALPAETMATEAAAARLWLRTPVAIASLQDAPVQPRLDRTPRVRRRFPLARA